MPEAYELPDLTITTDPGRAAIQWSEAFYKAKDALARIRPIPEQLIRRQCIMDLPETLAECDAALTIGEPPSTP